MKRILVIGGYGTFGGHVCRELVARGIPIMVAGRNGNHAKIFAESLVANNRRRACQEAVASLPIDISKSADCHQAMRDFDIVVNCAGPFQNLNATLVEACLHFGCHYADINDHRGYAKMIRCYDERFREKGLMAVHGCSSLPGISGALALLARKQSDAKVERARITLFIGNKSPKGEAAVRSLLAGLGRPISAPQGEIKGYRDREVVSLPPPFGRRGVFNFDCPDYDLLPSLIGVKNMSVKVGFELRTATYLFALLAALRLRYGNRTARLLLKSSRLASRLGCSGAAIMAELFFADGSTARLSLVAREDGQRMAALPCALAAQALSEERNMRPGVMTAYEYLGAEHLIAKEVDAGFELTSADIP